MHPSIAHRYGLRSEADIQFAEATIAKMRSLGLTSEQIDGIMTRHGELMPQFDTGRLDAAAGLQVMWEHAGQLGVSDEKREAFPPP